MAHSQEESHLPNVARRTSMGRQRILSRAWIKPWLFGYSPGTPNSQERSGDRKEVPEVTNQLVRGGGIPADLTCVLIFSVMGCLGCLKSAERGSFPQEVCDTPATETWPAVGPAHRNGSSSPSLAPLVLGSCSRM